LGKTLGFEAHAHALVGDEDGAWSSTRVRAAIGADDLDEAARLLGRPHMVRGTVRVGDQRGRTIGFPTANLPQVEEMLPPNGVYAVLVDREDAGKARALARGAANLGVRPTVAVGAAPALLEVHLLDAMAPG